MVWLSLLVACGGGEVSTPPVVEPSPAPVAQAPAPRGKVGKRKAKAGRSAPADLSEMQRSGLDALLGASVTMGQLDPGCNPGTLDPSDPLGTFATATYEEASKVEVSCDAAQAGLHCEVQLAAEDFTAIFRYLVDDGLVPSSVSCAFAG
ncbi:MAG: hypothetical protein H6738_22365 [Alphaproteobacteria bacterium]|nr:hypothetical protein [Alphaproteobacteria bacterium]MCB9699545.1 hypothetical protein [Alphaproteobacteria bacterium]